MIPSNLDIAAYLGRLHSSSHPIEKMLSSPVTLAQLLEDLIDDEHSCLNRPTPWGFRCKEEVDQTNGHARRKKIRRVRKALRALDRLTPATFDCLIILLTRIAKTCCCIDHQEDENIEQFAYHWIAAPTLATFLDQQGWEWNSAVWCCLGDTDVCLPLRKGRWKAEPRSAVYHSLNILAISAAFPGYLASTILESAIDDLGKLWTCRIHRNQIRVIRELLRCRFIHDVDLGSSGITDSPVWMQDPGSTRSQSVGDAVLEQHQSAITSNDHAFKSRNSFRQSTDEASTPVTPSNNAETSSEESEFSETSETPATSLPSSLNSSPRRRNDSTDSDYSLREIASPSPCPHKQRGRTRERPYLRESSARPRASSAPALHYISMRPARPQIPETSRSAPQVPSFTLSLAATDGSQSTPTTYLNTIPVRSQSQISQRESLPPVQSISGEIRLSFEWYASRAQSFGEISQKVYELVQEGIKMKANVQTRSMHGWIYVLQSPEYPNFVKIGLTTRKIADRLVEIANCDKLELRVVDPGSYTKVSYIKRLEKLIFADSANERCKFPCVGSRSQSRSPRRGSRAGPKNCTEHGEWFIMTVEEALRRVQNWRDWMRQGPYNDHGQLKDEFGKRIEFCARNYELLERENQNGERWKTLMAPTQKIDDQASE